MKGTRAVHPAARAGLPLAGETAVDGLEASLGETLEDALAKGQRGATLPERAPAEYIDKAVELCRDAGFRKVTLRGDTDFSLTWHFDAWDDLGVRFIFGFDCTPAMRARAEEIAESEWVPLQRPPKYVRKTAPRARPEKVKERIVKEREFESIRLEAEAAAEFEYRPAKSSRPYRIVVTRKNLTVARGEREFFDDIRYFFYITNDRKTENGNVVLLANDRCNQENLIDQLKNGLRSMRMPVDNLLSNWAYMVMSSLAWSLKAWLALCLPAKGRWREKHETEQQSVLRMEFKRFVNSFVRIPAQIVKTGRRIVYRVLGWNPSLHVLIRAVERFDRPLLC